MTMSITESFKTNRLMRERYFRMNGITHAEICNATDSAEYRDENAYKVMLGDGNGSGWWEPRAPAPLSDGRG